MRCLSIQIDTQRDPSVEVSELLHVLKQQGRYPDVDHDQKTDTTVLLNFFSDDVAALWQELQQQLWAQPRLGQWLQRVEVVACEGDQGWDNSLLRALAQTQQ